MDSSLKCFCQLFPYIGLEWRDEKRKRILESCLTLVRSLYSKEEVTTNPVLIYFIRKLFKTMWWITRQAQKIDWWIRYWHKWWFIVQKKLTRYKWKSCKSSRTQLLTSTSQERNMLIFLISISISTLLMKVYQRNNRKPLLKCLKWKPICKQSLR